ncbi:hypothetical protein SAMN05216262_104190 [Colwellia chukchiensis]|uniref:Uncharacterized protein n=1 Tax=Colwellia chukchiensis TaxID=641665 RepID=A0A1H7LLP0_9GAMM|nr:hypothetical protein [Colwellia chukchiensis]SEK99385.1 hypothetical protein SAMN05216262_104190 [Colwellia chukchiensis]
MIKWLVITVVTLVGFMIILLSLGYLLKENEQATRLLQQQLMQQAQPQQSKALKGQTQITTDNGKVSVVLAQSTDTLLQTFNETLVSNLTCVSVEQCQLLRVAFKNTTCQFASNSIGAAKLKKLATDTIEMANCTMQSSSQLVCQQNLCQLVPNSH